jgi:hypothetical protein
MSIIQSRRERRERKLEIGNWEWNTLNEGVG